VRSGEDDAGQRADLGCRHETAIVHVTRLALNEVENAARQDGCGGREKRRFAEGGNDGLKTAVIHTGYTSL